MTKDFNGAVLVLTDATRAEEIAARFAAGYFPDSEYHYTVTPKTPTSLPVDLRDQVDTQCSRAGDSAQVLTVYPWAATESTLPERQLNGKIPS